MVTNLCGILVIVLELRFRWWNVMVVGRFRFDVVMHIDIDNLRRRRIEMRDEIFDPAMI